jgi:hypothetical protein
MSACRQRDASEVLRLLLYEKPVFRQADRFRIDRGSVRIKKSKSIRKMPSIKEVMDGSMSIRHTIELAVYSCTQKIESG